MKYVLGDPVVVGACAFAVVARQVRAIRAVKGQGTTGFCSKEPLFVVIRKGRNRKVMDMNGNMVPLQEVQELCPAVTTV